MSTRSWCVWATLLGSLVSPRAALADDPPARTRGGLLKFTVQAGQHERRNSLLRFEVRPDRLDPAVILAMHRGVAAVAVVGADATRSVAQISRNETGAMIATWFLPAPIAAGAEAHYEIVGGPVPPEVPSPFAVNEPTPGAVEIRNRGRMVLRYNATPVEPPPSLGKSDTRLPRDSYIHPAFSPGGALVTGDFSAYHPHHRGFFLAYVHTRWGDLAPDFWNIQNGTGRIVNERLERPWVGPISLHFNPEHRWEALGNTPKTPGEVHVALRERWSVEVYDVPGSPYWLFDLTATQQAETHPLEVLPHRYGGMAYRSAEPSVTGPLDVLTAEGRHRFDGDQKPTRWVDLTGPVTDGSPNYAGALMVDHAANPHHPTVVRIHPITLPFYSFVPAHDVPLTIPTDRPTTFRYRVMIHDGRPDPALNNRIAADYTDPPLIELN